MCGLFGYTTQGFEYSKRAFLEQLRHRGPDGNGAWTSPDGEIILGHTRLAIIDPSYASNQPMHYSNRYTIVFNGEIYNYKEIARVLAAEDIHLSTQSDTEVIVAAYARWGSGCLSKFRGMFAFAVWDDLEKTIFLGRDRFGIKPLYYFHEAGKLAFSSELKPLLNSDAISRNIDKASLAYYLSYCSVPQPRTIIRGIKMVPPGHFGVYRKGELFLEEYWNLGKLNQKGCATSSYEEACLRTRELLEEAIEYNLVSDVPIGAFLSGGIDSTILVGLMSKETGYPIKTFSVGFESVHSGIDELRWAEIAANEFGTEHQEIILRDNKIECDLNELIASIDQPSLDGANTYLISKEVSKHVKVALSGLGGDELFAGYPHFRQYLNASRRAPNGIKSLGPLSKSSLIPGRFRTPLRMYCEPAELRLSLVRNFAIQRNFSSFLNPDIAAQFYKYYLKTNTCDFEHYVDAPISQMSLYEIRHYLLNTLLRDNDAMSMRHALEIRPILLDHPLAEYVFNLPSEYKQKGRNFKRILKDSCKDLIPKEILQRTKKRGFELPLIHWIRGPLVESARRAFSGEVSNAIFSDQARTNFINFLDGKSRMYSNVWGYFILIKYLEQNKISI